MVKWALAILLMVSVLLSGCAEEKDNTTTQKRYSDDGYLGQSTANPGILTSPGSRTFSNDADLVDQALQGLRGIRRKTMQINGGDMLVRIKVNRDLDDNQVAALRKESLSRLSAMFPRYDVRVRVSR